VRSLNRLRKGRQYALCNGRKVHSDCDGAIAARRAKWETWEKEAEEAQVAPIIPVGAVNPG